MKLLGSRRTNARGKRARRIALLLGAGALLWLVYTAARSRVLLANGRAIEAQSASYARDYFVGETGAPVLTYLAMGDSTAAGWGAGSLQATYPHLIAQSLARRGYYVRVRNVAVGGATARDVRTKQLSAIADFRPNIITLSVGANDATHFTSPDDYGRELNAIVAALDQSSALTILVADTPDMFLAPALPLPLSWATARRARNQNEILTRIVRDSRVRVVPLYEQGKLDARVEPRLYAADRFHPSAAGYARWAALFTEKMEPKRLRTDS